MTQPQMVSATVQLYLGRRVRKNLDTCWYRRIDGVLRGLDFSTDLVAKSKRVHLFKPLWLLISVFVRCTDRTKQLLKKSKMTIEQLPGSLSWQVNSKGHSDLSPCVYSILYKGASHFSFIDLSFVCPQPPHNHHSVNMIIQTLSALSAPDLGLGTVLLNLTLASTHSFS